MDKKAFSTRAAHVKDKAFSDIINGNHPFHLDFNTINARSPSLVGTGVSVFLDQNHANSVTPKTRNVISMSPEATILIKKKAFSSLKSVNDLRWMDKTEKMLLRATKALFAYKVQQIRAYESLTKFETYYSNNQEYSMNLLSSFLKEGSLLDLDKLEYTASEYASAKLQTWLDSNMETTLTSDDGTGVTYDVASGNYYNTEDKLLSESLGVPGDPDAVSRISTSYFNKNVSITNREYIATLSSSQAKAILDAKKTQFKAEYEQGTADGTNNELTYKDIFDGEGFFKDLGDLLAYSTNSTQYDAANADIVDLLKRNAFSIDNHLTTWIVDPDSAENYTIGPGTGVIELALFESFNCNSNIESAPSSASVTVQYPYQIGTILEDDIETALEEALNGTIGVLNDLVSGGLRSEGLSGGMPPIDGASIVSAALEMGGAGDLDSSLDMDYVRERLTTFYLGKAFINAADPIHIYVRGNRTLEDLTEAASDYSSAVTDSPFDKEYLEIDQTILKAEYQLYTNQGISFEQYKAIRRRQDNSFGMIHIFGGFVREVTVAYSGGYWNLSLSCTDNMGWLQWSRFATHPALSDPRGILEDPLTPYELVKDSLGNVISSETDLLYENKALLESGLLSYDSGLFAGQNATEGNLLQGQFNDFGSLNGKKVLQHPGGFIYRWKDGIITATAGLQAGSSEGEGSRVVKTFSQNYSVTPAGSGSGSAGVLNNLDMANILSVLIVGQPYNMVSFLEQAVMAQNVSSRTSTTLNPSDPITAVLQTLRKQNSYYGNFSPYRMLSVSAATSEQIVNQYGMRETANTQVKLLQRRKVALRKQIRKLKKSNSDGVGIPPSAMIGTLQAEINTVDKAIGEKVRIGTKYGGAVDAMDEVGIQISLTSASTGLPVSDDEDENHDVTRAMMLVGAQRRIEDVRLNRDRNLFIVSDQYDMADIRPFILKISNTNYNRWSGTFANAYSQAVSATKFMHMEFFCNTQGHLEFRPPLWNRTPLTVLKEAIRIQEETGKVIMPDFITNLFSTRIEALYLEVHSLNIRLVLLALMIGRYPDRTMIPNVKLTGGDSLDFFGVQAPVAGGVFGDIANFFSAGTAPQVGDIKLKQREYASSTGSLTEINNELFGDGLKITASFQDKGDVLDGDTETLLGTFDVVFQEEAGILNDLLTAAEAPAPAAGSSGGIRPPAAHLSTIDNLNAIRDDFKSQFGRDPGQGTGIDTEKGFQIKDIIWNKDPDELDQLTLGSNGILEKINKTISQRDSYVSMLQANISKQEELEEISGILSGDLSSGDDIEVGEGPIDGPAVDFLEKLATSMQSAVDIITGKAAEGTVYDHLIEDDTRNLLGYGSGKRYIITDEHIVTATFREKPPEFTSINVSGTAPFVGEDLMSSTEGKYYWAGATDFDLWRQYGYKDTSMELPFISDTEGQARPYAMLELILQKAGVNTASLSVVGNEFYQPGDTVYIPSRGLLYYVQQVNHKFQYGSNFTTDLSLVYGHAPGRYLPSPLDVIGQEYVGNQMEDPAINYRTESSEDDNYRALQPDCSLVFPTGGASMAELLSYKDNQLRFTNMMIDLSGGSVANSYVLIRGFVKDSNDTDAVNNIREKMSVVSALLQDPSQVSQNHAYSGGDDLVEGFGQAITSVGSVFGGGSVGTTNSLNTMQLPNNMPATPISATKIIEQIVYLSKDEDESSTGEIKCLNRKLMAALLLESNEVDPTGTLGIFPKGGPTQNTWLDFRDEVANINFSGEINAIEVGIIDIPNSILTKNI